MGLVPRAPQPLVKGLKLSCDLHKVWIDLFIDQRN
jgi:hypothetical protein